MSTTISIPQEEYNYLKKCENIINEINEDESLSEDEIRLINDAKKSKMLTKEEFLEKYKELQNE